MKRMVVALLALMPLMAMADSIDVKSFVYQGPYEMGAPVMLDSVDVKANKYDASSLLEQKVRVAEKEGVRFEGAFAPMVEGKYALHTLSFSVQNARFQKVKVSVKGLKHCKVMVDGEAANGSLSLAPSRHEVVIKYLSAPDEKMDSLKVAVEVGSKEWVQIVPQQMGDSGMRPYTIKDVLLGERITGVSMSPNGKYVIVRKSVTEPGGRTSARWEVRDVASGGLVDVQERSISWMPRTNKYWRVKDNVSGKGKSHDMVVKDPVTRVETVWAKDVPNEYFVVAPTEDYLVVSRTQEGRMEDAGVYQVLEPDDRQPGWRNRQTLDLYDVKSGVTRPLTFGNHNVYLLDISQDGRYLLMMKSESRLTQRPTTVSTIYRLDVKTMDLETIVEKDGFVASAAFSADGKSAVVMGSPECLGGIGNVLPEGVIPSSIDNQLYLYDFATKKFTPLTRDFAPCVQSVSLSAADGMFYFTAEDKDCVHLYQLNPKTKKIRQVKEPEDMVSGMSVASGTGAIAFYGQGAMNSDRLYTISPKSMKVTLMEDLSATRLDGIKIGECKAWTYVNAQGDSICCRYYLPADFDKTKKYPMIVNYYGGCSPTGRAFESRYPHHAYAALGYVVLVVNPHGATGFGQEWSAAHVNTAGRGPAEDIIESTKAFCNEHEWVNAKKIGCIGASYGGFMTQYLQTVTDIFAAAVSHAGISDHTSYWGYGYWGYSYSEVSMANSYPWTRKDLFVDQSPLFNADKVHTPLLFVHGDADVNVPVNESIQMFTALKLLGRETAMVLVKDQDHHILEYDKRMKWQNTIWAWFAKWLQDDDTWWKEMYK